MIFGVLLVDASRKFQKNLRFGGKYIYHLPKILRYIYKGGVTSPPQNTPAPFMQKFYVFKVMNVSVVDGSTFGLTKIIFTVQFVFKSNNHNLLHLWIHFGPFGRDAKKYRISPKPDLAPLGESVGFGIKRILHLILCFTYCHLFYLYVLTLLKLWFSANEDACKWT